MTADAFDLNNVWHPYSSLIKPIAPLQVNRAEGVYLHLNDGSPLIDAMASWWSVIHGYNHPTINASAKQQLDTMSHVMFGGLTHSPAIDLCKQLVELAPPSLDKVFLSDSGSVSVEVALKLALQFWRETGFPQKTRFVALRNGYHGDTLGAMSVCDPVTGMHHLFKDSLPKQHFVEQPGCLFGEICSNEHIAPLKNLLEKKHHEIAALILEPIVQGTGGMFFYSADYLKQARELCDNYNVLLIADEIATGFARTGKLFACNHADITPDIMCLGKALTGGYLSLAATLTNERIAHGTCSGEAGAFMHGPTFMANPLACKIATTSINLLLESDWQNNIARIQERLALNLLPFAKHTKVRSARVLGAIGVLETNVPVDMRKVQKILPSLGVWLRPFGTRVYTMPPYITTNDQLDKICDAMIKVCEQCS